LIIDRKNSEHRTPTFTRRRQASAGKQNHEVSLIILQSKNMQRIILASQSRYRKMALEMAGIECEVMPVDLDEKQIQDADPYQRVQLVAEAKARAAALRVSGIIISGDTYTVMDGRTFEKPHDQEEAKRMLRTFSGKLNICLTGSCVYDTAKDEMHSFVAETKVYFRTLDEDEIDAYVRRNPVTIWAAAYNGHDTGELFERIEGSYAGFAYGIPLEFVVPTLRSMGVASKD
jgi:septum formation protein